MPCVWNELDAAPPRVGRANLPFAIAFGKTRGGAADALLEGRNYPAPLCPGLCGEARNAGS